MAIEWTKEQMKYFISEYKKLNTPLVWDALFVQYGYRNQILRREVKPILRDMKLAGPAVTIKGTTNVTPFEEEFDHKGPGPLGGMWIRVGQALTEDCVVIIDPGYTEVAVLGDIFGQTWHHMGMQGLVCDGPIRDSFGFLEDDISTFCTDTMCICAEGHWRMTDSNVPLWLHGQLGEVLVNPGDFIFADADGVLVIPNDMIEKVLINAKERAANEIKTKADIKAGKTPEEMWYEDGHSGVLDEDK